MVIFKGESFPQKIFDSHALSHQKPKSFHHQSTRIFQLLETWSDGAVGWDEGRGWRVGGPWPAWPSGGIRFDWIGVGDLCIKLRLPCDPAIRREIHTAARGRAGGGSPLTSCTLLGSIGFCPAGFLSWVYFSILSVPSWFCSPVLFESTVLFPLFWFGSPASIHSSLFHFVSSDQYSPLRWSVPFCSITQKPNSADPDPAGCSFLIWHTY